MNAAALREWRNAAADSAASPPLISVAVPFYRYDVLPLARELIAQARADAPSFELLFADDGSPEPESSDGLQLAFAAAPVAARILRATTNVGRSAIRNRLVAAARGDYILLIDCDMLPDHDDYLARYRALAGAATSDIVCGGRSYQRVTSVRAEQRLYRAFSARTECLPAAVRQAQPSRYVMTNNLLVRRSLLAELPFAEDYRGWGYEDADWGFRIAARGILHVDNTASHFGLISDHELLAKMDESAANLLLIAQRQPAFRAVPAYRYTQLAAQLPVAGLRALSRWLALNQALPLRLRQLAVQAYRMAIYAAALRASGARQ